MQKMSYISIIVILLVFVGCAAKPTIEEPVPIQETSKSAPIIETPKPEPKPVAAAPMDSDHDGVLDPVDKCPNTMEAFKVDKDGCTNYDKIPQFPWPPPKPSTYARFPSSDILLLHKPNIGSVADSLEHILKSAGYSEFHYYVVPTGIAMATQLERIDTNGIPYKVPERWNVTDLSLNLESWSIWKYLKTLARANPGHYRVMVFLITDEGLVIKFDEPPQDETIVNNFVENGAINLPSSLRKKPITSNYMLTILVYELKRRAQSEDVEIDDLGISAIQHLSRTNIKFKEH